MSLYHGDCLEVMAGMAAESVDAIVTDPPYGLEFMGKEWDKLWDKRPHGGGRSDHVGSDGVRRKNFMSRTGPTFVAGQPAQEWHARWAEAAYRVAKPSAYLLAFGGTRTVHRMTCAIEDAGWIVRDMLVWAYASGFPKSKASLKPAWEPIVMARKPGPLRELAIDACRIPAEPYSYPNGPKGNLDPTSIRLPRSEEPYTSDGGRWPANVILTDPIFDGGWEGVVGGGQDMSGGVSTYRNETGKGGYHGTPARPAGLTIGYPDDGGTYSRFFLVPKASRADREPALTPDWFEGTGRVSTHPTVKPVDLMRHLVRLVTPTGGIVLDPFLGSGTTAIAAEMEGFGWVGIEREAEYVAIAEARLNGTQRGLGLPA